VHIRNKETSRRNFKTDTGAYVKIVGPRVLAAARINSNVIKTLYSDTSRQPWSRPRIFCLTVHRHGSPELTDPAISETASLGSRDRG
jgi:hypothetical protein